MGDVHNGGNDEGLGASKQDNSSFSGGHNTLVLLMPVEYIGFKQIY